MSTAHDRPAGSAGAHAGTSGDYGARGAAHQQATGYQPGAGEARYVTEGADGAFAGRLLAGTLMIISGLWSFFVGIAAIIKGSFFTTSPNYVINWNITGWGWTELIVGIVICAAGASVLLGMLWARIVGVFLAAVSALQNFMFLPRYPVWSLIVIALDVFIIWALCARVREPA